MFAWLSLTAWAAAPLGDPTADLVRTWLVRDGVRAEPAALAAAAAPLCSERPVACLVANMRPDDPGLPGALGDLCDAGDAAACLGAAWLLMPLAPEGRLYPPSDPVAFRARVVRACEAGLADGCVEVGATFGRGLGTYQSARRAAAELRPLCVAGYPRACTALGLANGEPNLVKMGAREGDAAALARSTEPADWATACALGHTGACVAAAHRDPDRETAGMAYDRACALGDVDGCVARVRSDAVQGAITPQAAADRLDAYCPQSAAACQESRFYRQGAVPVVEYTGKLTADALDRKMIAARGPLFECYRQYLGSGGNERGVVPIAIRVEEDGEVSGVHLPAPFSADYATCVEHALLEFPVAQPWGHGPALVPFSVVAQHAAKIGIRAVEAEGLNFAGRVYDAIPRWQLPVDLCFLDHDSADPGVVFELGFTVRKNGRMKDFEVLKTSETPEVDRCIIDFLSPQRLAGPKTLPTRLVAQVKFILPDWDPPAPPAPTLRDRRKDVPPVDVSTLVLLVQRSSNAEGISELSAGAARAIAAAHEAMAERVRADTGGLVRLQTEVRTVEATLAARVDELEPGLTALSVDEDELPPALLAAIEPGRWDSVFVWAPAPPDTDDAVDGETLSVLLRGATASFLATRGAPRGGDLAPLHAWWHQVVERANRLLGVEVITNHEPYTEELDDPSTDDPEAPLVRRTYDPRTWTDAGNRTVDEWYARALGALLDPELWPDLWHYGERAPDPATNLALSARPLVNSVLDEGGLNDTWLDAGDFGAPPRVDPDAIDFWFGLAWDAPVTASRLAAWVGQVAAPAVPSFTSAEVDVVLADDPGNWRRLDAACVAVEARLECTFAPTSVLALRLRPASLDAVVRELAVR